MVKSDIFSLPSVSSPVPAHCRRVCESGEVRWVWLCAHLTEMDRGAHNAQNIHTPRTNRRGREDRSCFLLQDTKMVTRSMRSYVYKWGNREGNTYLLFIYCKPLHWGTVLWDSPQCWKLGGETELTAKTTLTVKASRDVRHDFVTHIIPWILRKL